MKRQIVILMVLVGVCCALPSQAGHSSHYTNGVEGIKAGSLPPPGLYGRVYAVYYNADTMRDHSGDDLDLKLELDVMAVVPRLIWMTPLKILGADYGMDIVLPYQRIDIELGALNYADEQVGLGDLYIEPLLLGWNFDRFDLCAAAGVYFPTGHYDVDEAASPGMGFRTYMFTLGGTYYFDEGKTWAASILNRYEINDYRSDPSVRPGDCYHFEWGISNTFAEGWEAGLVGYCLWQITDDRGREATAGGNDPEDHERVFAIGPGISYFIGPPVLWNVSLRWEHELGARDRAEGSLITLTLTKPF